MYYINIFFAMCLSYGTYYEYLMICGTLGQETDKLYQAALNIPKLIYWT